MGVGQKLKEFHRSRKKYLLTLALLVLTLVLLVFFPHSEGRRKKLDYAASLDLVAAEVNGRELTLRELAFYVAYEEAQVQEQAITYDPEKPEKYWNARGDKVFIRVAARNAAIQMAVHDAIFADLADAEEVRLTAEEEQVLLTAQENFWRDLVEDGRNAGLGVAREDIYESMRIAALAQKYQELCELVHSAEEGDYSYNGSAYEELLGTQDYKIYEKVWKQVNFGNVTLRYE